MLEPGTFYRFTHDDTYRLGWYRVETGRVVNGKINWVPVALTNVYLARLVVFDYIENFIPLLRVGDLKSEMLYFRYDDETKPGFVFDLPPAPEDP